MKCDWRYVVLLLEPHRELVWLKEVDPLREVKQPKLIWFRQCRKCGRVQEKI